jgi:HSP20 family molecular chaperone IbpA
MSNEVAETGSGLELREKQALQQEGTRPGMVFRPDVDILERGDAYLIYAGLPGVDDGHFQVRLEKGVLSLDAELATMPEAAWNPIHTEFRFGSFHRGIRAAFRDLARKHHPDIAGPRGAPAFREAVEAYRALSDPEARRDQ